MERLVVSLSVPATNPTAPATPPGYWDIGFPDTQAAADINRRAGALHEKKARGIEREAGREGGRYRRAE